MLDWFLHISMGAAEPERANMDAEMLLAGSILLALGLLVL
jgi:hypothetical protein